MMKFSKYFIFITSISILFIVFSSCSNKIAMNSQLAEIISGQLQIPIDELSKQNLLKLRELEIKDIDVQSLNGIEYCINLEKLALQNCKLSEITLIKHLTKLKHLNIALNPEIKDISPVGYLKGLEVFIASGISIRDITPLQNSLKLKRLYLNNTKEIKDISPLKNLHNLNVLEFYDNKVEDLGPLSNLENLERLWINQNNISDISHLQNLVNLKYLLAGNNYITDLDAIVLLKELTILGLSHNNISNISELKQLVEAGAFRDTSYNVWWVKGVSNSPFINLTGNPIELIKNSKNSETIELIHSRNISIKYD